MDIISGSSIGSFQDNVATIGFFDGVHRGHRFLLEQVKAAARKRGIDSAVVTFPVHPRKVLNKSFQPELLSTADEKLALLETTGVQHCIMLPFTYELSLSSAYDFMKLLREHFHIRTLVVGYDHQFGHNRTEKFEDYCHYGKELHIEVVCAKKYVEEGHTVSSSLIRRLLKEGKVEQANAFLGYAYSLSGIVVEGHRIGRELGFPTANLTIDDVGKLVPADGVYAAYVYMKKDRYAGMLNIGKRPTMDNGTDRTVEVHILNFSDDIYRQPLRMELLKYLRPERKYEQVEELVEQMKKDREEVALLIRV